MSGVRNVLGDMQGSYVPIAPRAAPAPQPAASTPPPAQPAPSPAPQAAPQTAPAPFIEQAAAYFQSKGLTPAQARGFAQAFMSESGGDPTAYNPAGGGLGAYGVAQDRGDRQRRLIQMYGPTPTVKQQLDFAWYELNTSEKGALNAVRQAKTPEEAQQAAESHFERPSLRGFFGSNLSEEQQHELSAYSTDQKALIERMRDHAAEYDRIANSSSPGDKDREQLISQMRAQSLEMQREWQQKVNSPPIQRPLDAWQAFANPAVILGLLAGLVGRQHLTLGLTAAGAALQAINQNDEKTYQRQYETWKLQTELGLKTIDMQNQDIQQLLEDRRYSVDEKRVRLETMAHELGFDRALASMGGDVYKYAAAAQNTAAQLQLRAATIQNTEAYRQAMLQARTGAGGGALDKNTLSTMADQYIAGDKSVLQGLGYGNAGAANRAALRTEISQKMMDRATSAFQQEHGRSPTDAEKEGISQDIGRQLALGIAEFGGLQQAERTGFGRVAQLTIGAQEAKQFTPLALQASQDVDRSRYPTLNKAELAVMEGTGDEKVINFVEANVALMDAYAQVIGRGNAQLTDSAREQARGLLNTAWSKGQYSTAVAAINREIDAALRAPKEMLETFRTGFAKGGEGLPDLGGGGGARPPQVSNQQQYDALPSGAVYVGPDGIQRTKR